VARTLKECGPARKVVCVQRQIDADFAAYVRARQYHLLRAAYLICGDADLAQDLLQEAFVKLAVRWERLRDERPDAYVRTILYRDAVSAWRKTRREDLAGLDVADRGAPAEQDDTSARLDTMRALDALTPRQRAVIVARYFDDRSERETADLLDISLGTVKSTAHDALTRLRERVPDLFVTTEGYP
jgi:RNA polymerase sigma-70 factor (sigma-E family)